MENIATTRYRTSFPVRSYAALSSYSTASLPPCYRDLDLASYRFPTPLNNQPFLIPIKLAEPALAFPHGLWDTLRESCTVREPGCVN
jgi:hypothetical protein